MELWEHAGLGGGDVAEGGLPEVEETLTDGLVFGEGEGLGCRGGFGVGGVSGGWAQALRRGSWGGGGRRLTFPLRRGFPFSLIRRLFYALIWWRRRQRHGAYRLGPSLWSALLLAYSHSTGCTFFSTSNTSSRSFRNGISSSNRIIIPRNINMVIDLNDRISKSLQCKRLISEPTGTIHALA